MLLRIRRTLVLPTATRVVHIAPSSSSSAYSHRLISATFSTHSTTRTSFHSAKMSAPSATTNNNASSTSAAEADIWHPKQYLLFDEIRARPGQELIARVMSTLATFGQSPSSVHRAVDLGC